MELLSPQVAGWIVVGLLLLWLTLGVHIGVALGLAGFIGIYLTVGPDAALAQIAHHPVQHHQLVRAGGDPAVHPDGLVRDRGGDHHGSFPCRLRLARQPARRPRHGDRDVVRRVRRRVGLDDRQRGGVHAHGDAGDDALRLRRAPERRLHRRRRHAGGADPAEHPDGGLRGDHRAVDRQAAHRRHRARHPHRADLLRRHLRHRPRRGRTSRRSPASPSRGRSASSRSTACTASSFSSRWW